MGGTIGSVLAEGHLTRRVLAATLRPIQGAAFAGRLKSRRLVGAKERRRKKEGRVEWPRNSAETHRSYRLALPRTGDTALLMAGTPGYFLRQRVAKKVAHN